MNKRRIFGKFVFSRIDYSTYNKIVPFILYMGDYLLMVPL